jgi:hypothetical protein
MKVNNDEEALKLMQDTQYGLTASVYTAFAEKGREILAQVNSRHSLLELLRPSERRAAMERQGTLLVLERRCLISDCGASTKPKGYHLRG